MKIRDIVIEAPGSYQDAYNKASSLFSPAKAITNNPDYQAGYAKTKNIFSPTKWFKSDKPADAAQTVYKSHQIRDTLNNAAAGKVYQDDVAILKHTHDQIKSGKIQPSVDAAQLLPILKAASQTQPISDNSKKLLAQFAKDF